MGWLPWKYEGERRILHTVKVVDGVSWTASCFIPFALFTGLSNAKPSTGTVWRGNVFRMDFDELPEAKWALDPQTGKEFHNYRDFGAFRFE
ncbi:MAG: hypothetical protein N3A54_05675 [Patescibacteria group bacterium]|nr:hypothetical protein [Patescibacteria group bacterium]